MVIGTIGYAMMSSHTESHVIHLHHTMITDIPDNTKSVLGVHGATVGKLAVCVSFWSKDNKNVVLQNNVFCPRNVVH